MEQYRTLTHLVRPGPWENVTGIITDELADNTTFAEGVIDEKVGRYTIALSQTPMEFTIYRGMESSEFDHYLVINDLPGSWEAYGYMTDDHEDILQSFKSNPVLI